MQMGCILVEFGRLVHLPVFQGMYRGLVGFVYSASASRLYECDHIHTGLHPVHDRPYICTKHITYTNSTGHQLVITLTLPNQSASSQAAPTHTLPLWHTQRTPCIERPPPKNVTSLCTSHCRLLIDRCVKPSAHPPNLTVAARRQAAARRYLTNAAPPCSRPPAAQASHPASAWSCCAPLHPPVYAAKMRLLVGKVRCWQKHFIACEKGEARPLWTWIACELTLARLYAR